ncbi:MAG: glycerate kinase, partial [Chloroflexi bacterium]|nr:glycerate kinase [Chloroflexota bacterium]
MRPGGLRVQRVSHDPVGAVSGRPRVRGLPLLRAPCPVPASSGPPPDVRVHLRRLRAHRGSHAGHGLALADSTERSGVRILVVPQEFKGSLTAAEAAGAITRGLQSAAAEAGVVVEIDLLPFADGGPGTAAVIERSLGGRFVRVQVDGPLGAIVEAEYLLIEGVPMDGDGPLAVIDSAAACGLVLIPEARRDPFIASSTGVGALILDAIGRGARRIMLGVGGTATNDGGAGAAQALGLRLLDAADEPLPPGAIHLSRLARIERVGWPPPIDLRIAVDVRNGLLGVEGATAVYGAQKGVQDWQAPALEAALA